MPVDSIHPDVETAEPKWRRMRDVLEGEDAVKAAGSRYLPRLNGSTQEEYDAYRTRAQFFAVTSAGRDAMEGSIYRKDPTVTVPDALAPFMQDVTLQGLSWYDYAKNVVHEVVSVGRYGSLIDFSADENRPYLVGYSAEAIRNWKVERIQGQMALSLLVLYEVSPEHLDVTSMEVHEPLAVGPIVDAPAKKLAQSVTGAGGEFDEFEHPSLEQWRVYQVLLDAEGHPYVRCRVYRKSEQDFVPVFEAIPTRRGEPLDRIPFVFHGAKNSLPDVGPIPLEALASVNLSLYRTSADLEHGRHWTGLPTPWASGFPATKSLKIGSSEAWVTEDKGAQCGFLEFTGTGLGALEKAVDQKTQQMAALGARMLEPEAKKAEAFDTVAMRSAAATSVLMNLTVASTQTLSSVLQLVAWWIGTEDTPAALTETAKTELNTEFSVMSLPPEQINAFVAAYLSGAMDWESFFWKMQQGEAFPPDADPDEVRNNIQNNPPGLPQPEPAPVP